MSRDITVGETIYIAFSTRAFATGIPTVLAGTPVVSAYEDAGLTQITAGITLGVDHDSVVGLNMLTIVATGANGYESGKDYALVITTGTVGGVSVVGEVVGEFTIGRSAAAVDLANGTDGLGALLADILDKLGAVDESAAADDPSSTESVMQYVKQIINILIGAAGIANLRAAAAPANNVSLSEMVRAIFDDSNSLDGTKIPDTLSLANINAEVDKGFTDHLVVRRNTAQAGAAGSITLDASASATTNFYRFGLVTLVGGTGAGQPGRTITAYDGSTKVATIEPDWVTNPASGTVFVITGVVRGLLTNSISTSELSNDTITAAKIAADAIGSSELADSAIQEISRAINPQKNSAFSNITFEMYDSTNHNPNTGLTVSGEVSKDGGAYGAVGGSIAEISDGTYQLDASSDDMNADLLVFRFSEGTSDDTFVHIKTAA